MALQDILDRIEGDAVTDAQALVDAARAQVARELDEARETAEAAAARVVRDAEREARRDAASMLAAARLSARDETLRARGALLDRALESLAEAVAGLPDSEYRDFLARVVADAARGGERVLVAEADASRLAGLEAALRARGSGVPLRFGETTQAIEHGALLSAEREVVDLSIAGLVHDRRDELVVRLARELFDEEGGA